MNAQNVQHMVNKLGGVLRCEQCRKEMPLVGHRASVYLQSGWPKCCGYTMQWVTKKELKGEAEG